MNSASRRPYRPRRPRRASRAWARRRDWSRVTFDCPPELTRAIEVIAMKDNISRSEIVRRAIKMGLDHQ